VFDTTSVGRAWVGHKESLRTGLCLTFPSKLHQRLDRNGLPFLREHSVRKAMGMLVGKIERAGRMVSKGLASGSQQAILVGTGRGDRGSAGNSGVRFWRTR
jgi:hypothetical protein